MINKQTIDVLYAMFQEEGVEGSIDIIAEVLSQYADALSDDGLKEKANEAIEMSSELNKILNRMADR
jgi:hypothetical protein